MTLPAHLQRYATAFAKASAETGLDALVIAALVDRESLGGILLHPPGPQGVGDNGHGHGLTQIDDRSWAQWLATNTWWDPTVNVCKGAEILNANLARFEGEFDPLFCALAAYNAGPGNIRMALKHLPPDLSDDEKRAELDKRTTGRNYASDILRRAASFRDTQGDANG